MTEELNFLDSMDFWSDRVRRNYFDAGVAIVVAPDRSVLSLAVQSMSRECTLVSADEVEQILNNLLSLPPGAYDRVYLEFEPVPALVSSLVSKLKVDGRIWINCSADELHKLIFPTGEDGDKALSLERVQKYFAELKLWNVCFGSLGFVFGSWDHVVLPVDSSGRVEIFAYRSPDLLKRFGRQIQQQLKIFRRLPSCNLASPSVYIDRFRSIRINSMYVASPDDQVIMNSSRDLFPMSLVEKAEKRSRVKVDLLETLVDRVCSGLTADRDRVKALYDFAQAAILRDVVAQPLRENGELPSAEAILLLGSGRCGHVSKVLVKMLNVAGIRVKQWQLPTHVTVKASISGNEWFLLDADVFKFGTPSLLNGDFIFVDQIYDQPSILNRIPATGWFYDDLICNAAITCRGYVEALPYHIRGFTGDYFQSELSRFGRDCPAETFFELKLQLSPCGHVAELTWEPQSLGRSDFVTYEVRISSKSRGWSYGTFRESRLFPSRGLGDLQVARTSVPRFSIDMEMWSRTLFVEVTAVTRAIESDPSVYCWPSDEVMLSAIS